MINYNITKTTMALIKPLMEQYFQTLCGVTEDFWEEHIIEAEFYQIISREQGIGYFAIYNNEKITQFYLQDQYLVMAQMIFKQILEEYDIKTAFVVTCDQLLLSLCLDFHKKIELQAYFFEGTVIPTRKAEYAREALFEVKPEELETVKDKTGDFFESVTLEQLESGKAKLYKLCEKEEILGFGIIVPNVLRPQYYGAGMITLEGNKQKGVGRSIQLHLADICKENGRIPVSGCWYQNHLSKKTIESSGRYTKTRLLNVIF